MSEHRQPERQVDAAEAERRQAEARELQDRMGRIGQKLLVLSGKGGVGKSTVAANLAAVLAAAGRTVGLLDVDVHGPSIPALMGIQDGRVGLAAGGLMLPVKVGDALSVMSIAFLLPEAGEPVIWRGPRKYGVIRQFLKDVAWGELDYLVIDSPPGTGDEPLSVAQLVGSPAGAIIVTTPQDLAIADVRRCIAFCRAVFLPVVGIIENMSTYVCPHCRRPVDLFKTGGGEALATEMDVPFLGRIPVDPAVVRAGDAGTPLADIEEGSPAARAFAEIVSRFLAGTSTKADAGKGHP